jgi:hypothetical protein
MRVRLAAEKGHHVSEVDGQQEHACDSERRAEPPASARDGEPDREADHRHGGVLAAGQRQHQRDGAPRVAAGVERERRDHDQGNRERLRVDVAEVDAVQRRVDQKEQREGAGGRARAEPAGRVAEHGEPARAEHQGLGDDQPDRAGRDPEERHQQIEHGREMVAPGAHRRKRHVCAAAGGQAPDGLDVVAEVQSVGPERQVSRDYDEPHHQHVAEHTDQRGSRGRHRGESKRGYQRPQRHDHREAVDEIVGPRERPAGERDATRAEHHEQEQSDARRDRLQRAGGMRHGRRVYLARRLSKRRERRRPRLLSVNQNSTERIRRP